MLPTLEEWHRELISERAVQPYLDAWKRTGVVKLQQLPTSVGQNHSQRVSGDANLGTLCWLLISSAESGGEDLAMLIRVWALSVIAPLVGN